MTVTAQAAEILSQGANFGFLGWLVALAALLVILYGWYVFIPSAQQRMKQEQLRFEAEQRRADADLAQREAVSLAVREMCAVVGDTHKMTLRIDAKLDGTGTDMAHLKAANLEMVSALRQLSERNGGAGADSIGAARARLSHIHSAGDEDDLAGGQPEAVKPGSPEHPPLGPASGRHQLKR